jgi:hypothetical protein
MIGSKRREATTSFAVATFAAGVVFDGFKDMFLNPPDDGLAKGVWCAVLVIAFVAMIYYFCEGVGRTRAARSLLQDIKDDHDFGETA